MICKGFSSSIIPWLNDYWVWPSREILPLKLWALVIPLLPLSSPNPTETTAEVGKHKPTEWKIEDNLQKAQELVASGTYESRD